MPLLEPLMPLLDPVVPFAASGYFFIKARHCESFCIALGDMPWHFVQVAFSLLVMLDDDAANPAPANAAVMQTPRAKVASVFIGVSSFSGEGTSCVPLATRASAPDRSSGRAIRGNVFLAPPTGVPACAQRPSIATLNSIGSFATVASEGEGS
jgi:hypothetical protein